MKAINNYLIINYDYMIIFFLGGDEDSILIFCQFSLIFISYRTTVKCDAGILTAHFCRCLIYFQ